MLAELERLKTGTGLLCSYPKGVFNQAVAVLIQDPKTPESAKKDAVFQLNGYFSDINRANPLVSKHETPVIVELSDDTNLDLAAETVLEGSQQKALFTCENWVSYARLCNFLGITRADHIALAQKGSMFHEDIIDANKGQKVKSKAKKFIKNLKRGQVSMLNGSAISKTNARKALADATKIIDRVKIFSLGDTDKYAIASEELGEAWEYHLPYEVCFFERKSLGDVFDENFYLAYISNKRTWEVTVLPIMYGKVTNGKFVTGLCQFTYDPDNPFSPSSVLPLAPPRKSFDPDKAYKDIVSNIFPYIAAINKPTTVITKHVDTLARTSRKSASYDVHTIDFDASDSETEYIEKNRSIERFNVAVGVHDRRAHKRRRPRTPITTPKTVRVKSTTVGNPEKGARARVFRAVDDRNLENE